MTTPTPDRECKAEEVSADQMEIRRLRHELDGLTRAGVVECMARNPAVFERISDLERDLAAEQEARQAAEALAESERKDAERWRIVRERFIAFDWSWNSPPIPVAIFHFPECKEVWKGPECADAIADAAIAGEKK